VPNSLYVIGGILELTKLPETGIRMISFFIQREIEVQIHGSFPSALSNLAIFYHKTVAG